MSLRVREPLEMLARATRRSVIKYHDLGVVASIEYLPMTHFPSGDIASIEVTAGCQSRVTLSWKTPTSGRRKTPPGVTAMECAIRAGDACVPRLMGAHFALSRSKHELG